MCYHLALLLEPNFRRVDCILIGAPELCLSMLRAPIHLLEEDECIELVFEIDSRSDGSVHAAFGG